MLKLLLGSDVVHPQLVHVYVGENDELIAFPKAEQISSGIFFDNHEIVK